MKNDKHIITEKYRKPLLGRWTRERFSETIKNDILGRFLKKDLRKFFDNFFVPADWFSFKDFFKMDEDSFEITNVGDPTQCNVEFSCTKELSPEEVSMLIFGDPNEKKYGGLMYNPNFENKLTMLPEFENVDLSSNNEDESSKDDEADEEDDSLSESVKLKNIFYAYKFICEADEPDETDETDESDEPGEEEEEEEEEEPEEASTQPLKLSIEFKFDAVKYCDDAEGIKFRARDYLNPNYVTNLHAFIYFKFNDNVDTVCKVGEVTFYPKRTKNMEPPKPKHLISNLKDNVKNLWSDTMAGDKPTDFGIAGVLAKTAFKKAIGGISDLTDGLDVIQEERVKLELNANFSYQNAFKLEEDREEAEREAAEKGGAGAESIKDKINSELEFNDSKLSVEINDTKREMKILVKSSNGTILLSLSVEPKSR